MSDKPTDGVMGSLPRTRPHRRSAKRGPAAEPAPSPSPTADSQPAKATPVAKGKAKAAPAAPRKANTAAPRKANTIGAGGAAGSAGRPVRSLQSATAPRAASDRSRKPGATSQAHHQAAARPVRPPVTRRSAPPAAEPAGAVGTAVQAAAELTEIGLKASARALRSALARLPRP